MHGPGNLSSRPTSARSNSQSRQPTTPSRGGYSSSFLEIHSFELALLGSAKDHRISSQLSSARQRYVFLCQTFIFLSLRSICFRRHSNSGQRPAWLTSPAPDVKQVSSSPSEQSVFIRWNPCSFRLHRMLFVILAQHVMISMLSSPINNTSNDNHFNRRRTATMMTGMILVGGSMICIHSTHPSFLNSSSSRVAVSVPRECLAIVSVVMLREITFFNPATTDVDNTCQRHTWLALDRRHRWK